MPQKITQITLVKCNTIYLILDLDKVDRNSAQINNLGFEDIHDLILEFKSLNNEDIKFMFTNIISSQLIGKILKRSEMLEMFFKQSRKSYRNKTSVSFLNLDVRSSIDMLSFQNIGHVTVSDSHFENISNLDIPSNTKCHNNNNRQVSEATDVSCSISDLFHGSKYSPTR